MLNIKVDVEALYGTQEMLGLIAVRLLGLPQTLRTMRFMREISQAVAAEEAGILPSRYQSFEQGNFDDARYTEIVSLFALVESVVPEPESGAVESTDTQAIEAPTAEAFESEHPDPEERPDMTEWTLSILSRDLNPAEAEQFIRTSPNQHYIAIPHKADWLLFGLHRDQVKVVDVLHEELPSDSGFAERMVQTGMNYGLWSEMNDG